MRPTKLTISTAAIAANLREIAQKTHSAVMAVVKADAYGHGAVPVARACLRAGAAGFAVATAEEALELRENGIDAPVLVLGAPDRELLEDMIARGVSFAVFDAQTLAQAQKLASARHTRALAHLKIDTGMRRIGAPWDDLDALLRAWESCPDVQMEGAFSHFAAADGDEAFTRLQAERFEAALQNVRARGFAPMRHMAASSAMGNAALRYDQVRAGIALYGTGAPGFALRYAQELATRAVRIAWIGAGETVGYGRTFTAARDTRVATLPIGYGDGYPRILGNRADVLVCGKRAPVIGRVCMDMLMVDVTDVPEADMADDFVLLGAQGSERITPDELAEHAQTIPYEIMLGFSPRVRREWDNDEI